MAKDINPTFSHSFISTTTSHTLTREDIIDFLKNIKFSYVQPFTNLSLKGVSNDVREALEFANTIIPIGEEYYRAIIHPLYDTPKMSTFAIGTIINAIVSTIPEDSVYLNIGVWHGWSLLCGIVGNQNTRCIGIDNFSQFGGPKNEFLERFNQYKSSMHLFYEMDYKVYFEKHHDKPIGIYFYDGNHEYSHQFEALEIAHPYIIKNGYILVDDTNWDAPRKATFDFISKYSELYQVIFDQKTAYNGHPTFWNGLIILQKN